MRLADVASQRDAKDLMPHTTDDRPSDRDVVACLQFFGVYARVRDVLELFVQGC